jgi:hypothetical protein
MLAPVMLRNDTVGAGHLEDGVSARTEGADIQ